MAEVTHQGNLIICKDEYVVNWHCKNIRYKSTNIIYFDKNTENVLRILSTSKTLDGHTLFNASYVRYRYDNFGNCIYYGAWKRVDGADKKFEIHLKYFKNYLTSYVDSRGNEWKRYWQVKNPFELHIENYINLTQRRSHIELKSIECQNTQSHV
jgi:hypothetical protein